MAPAGGSLAPDHRRPCTLTHLSPASSPATLSHTLAGLAPHVKPRCVVGVSSGACPPLCHSHPCRFAHERRLPAQEDSASERVQAVSLEPCAQCRRRHAARRPAGVDRCGRARRRGGSSAAGRDTGHAVGAAAATRGLLWANRLGAAAPRLPPGTGLEPRGGARAAVGLQRVQRRGAGAAAGGPCARRQPAAAGGLPVRGCQVGHSQHGASAAGAGAGAGGGRAAPDRVLAPRIRQQAPGRARLRRHERRAAPPPRRPPPPRPRRRAACAAAGGPQRRVRCR